MAFSLAARLGRAVAPLATAAAAALAVPAALVSQIHVDASAQAGGNGQSWATAYDSLQTALASAGAGQTVWVAAGSYAGGFVVPANVTVRGGFAAGMRRADQARPTEYVATLTGGGTQRVVQLGDGSVLDGFLVREGNAGFPGGGGALIDGVTATIRRCEFTANTNSGGRGAALTVSNGGDATVTDSIFHHNSASGHTIDVATQGRGTFTHLTIVDNPHNGLHMQQLTVCTIRDSIFARNAGRGICDVMQGNQPTVDNNLFWANVVSAMHVVGNELHTANAINALTYASGNIIADPLFVGAIDYRLQSSSPAIDLGVPGLPTRLDLGGFPRATDGDLDGTLRTDAGAHEFDSCVLTVTGQATGGSTITLDLQAAPAFGGIAMLFPGPTTTVAPFGTLYGTSPIVAILGFLPGNLPVALPPGLVADVVFQGFCLSPNSTGNLSNPLALAIQ